MKLLFLVFTLFNFLINRTEHFYFLNKQQIIV
jgi:hypothetical protein